MFDRLGRAAANAALAMTALLTISTGSATAAFGSLPPANPHLGPLGTATMHGDAESSDATPFAGPGPVRVDSDFRELAAACPTILQGADGMPQALCTKILGRSPKVFLLNPNNGQPLASLDLEKGSLLGGVYAYLDNHDRMVTVDGSGQLLRIAHRKEGLFWKVFVESRTDIAQAVTGHCGGGDCDAVSSVMPDFDGRVWFATDNAAAGFSDPATGTARSIVLGPGEKVANSISSAPEGVAIATTHALYLVDVDAAGSPRVVWRKAYDRGPARKPGQLSWGTGATPTFFGPGRGTEYLAITDNAVPKENLLVFDTDTGNQVCSVPTVDGTENSPIGSGNSLFVASTYGYPYPAVPEGAGPSQPADAKFTGGMVRVDVSGSGCTVVWTNDTKSAAVPRLSVADGKIYTIARRPTLPNNSSDIGDSYHYTVIDAATGNVDHRELIGATPLHDTLQMVGTISPDRTLYQGTMTGLFRIAPR
ncbi:hypothetical protein GV792_03125 [Nocardia cyriacigeorgica]|uniref:PQQ-binding-like beta-propeller repeat protein n=1 Tax=Nocardia cyriacigeorgica TaxID=135487 RepID=A0A6P1D9Q3_9NOCA|nr:hypothetical protein [Nocardia cyriacigeorgica]NEW37580.1 hypothetical protein [Nocardia cyriacigeorgica]NEW45022.1 hypothetical protein [Nocardia cyriacigeorgica]NEW49032.1 hypothetical protein [Nocardia cyriacigeorgica]